ncbi:MAG TPA: hypothetical protein PLI95_25290, partial [Polyangiaceae bacterium]|nr:hypothetical protein [Polyangiaceae bacterium]
MTSKIRLCPYRCGDMLGECSRDEHGKLVCGAVGGRPPFVKSVLLYAPSREHLQDLIDAFRRVSGCTVSGEGDRVSARYRDMILRFTFEEASCTDLQRLHDSYFNMVVVDLRPLCGRDELGEEYLRRAGCLLEAMDGVEDIETRYGFHRLMALVSARDDDRADRTIAELASKGLGRVVRDRSGCGGEAGVDEGKRGAFGRLVLDEMVALMLRRKVGRQALCASG